ncbi:hypothetical protein AB205_0090670 [Aquarana catesbeiana]|uniref:Uncharacterized protein n=1 Tax=Aquarana catesbeiana TaxID=8400 RepID=A0A2G9RXR6_AQUCT|nr:hypothetical protein AB205_0090670 [Aquarana catesbeiana]
MVHFTGLLQPSLAAVRQCLKTSMVTVRWVIEVVTVGDAVTVKLVVCGTQGCTHWLGARLQSIDVGWRKQLSQLSPGFGIPTWGSVVWRFHSVLCGMGSPTLCPDFVDDQQGVCSGEHSPYNEGMGIPHGSQLETAPHPERQEVSRSQRGCRRQPEHVLLQEAVNGLRTKARAELWALK